MGWIVPTSANLHDFCGEYNESFDLDDAIDQLGQWYDLVNHVHTIELDLGSSKNVGKVRFSDTGSFYAPTDLDVYVSDDTGDWGTAVLTGVDVQAQPPGSVEYVTTQKTGRYVKFVINATTYGSPGYIAWGGSGQEMFAIFDGVPPDVFSTYWNMLNTSYGTSSTTYGPTDGSLGVYNIPWNKFTNIKSMQLVARTGYVGSCVANSQPTTYVQLWDIDNSAEIAALQSSVNGVKESADFSGSIPSSASKCTIRVKKGCQTSAYVYHAYLKITQFAENDTETVIMFPLGANVNGGLTSYARTGYASAIIGGTRTQKHLLFDEANFDMDALDAAYVSATFYAQSGYTASVKVDNLGQTNTLAEFTETATTPTYHQSADISGSLVDDDEYTSFLKISGTRKTVYMKNAYLELHFTAPTKFLTMQPLDTRGMSTAASGWVETTGGSDSLMHDSDDDFYGPTVARKCQAILCHEGDTSMGASIYDDGTRDTDADVSTTSTSLIRQESGAVTGIADDSVLKPGYNLGSTGTFVYGQLASMMFNHYVTDIEYPAVASTQQTLTLLGVGS